MPFFGFYHRGPAICAARPSGPIHDCGAGAPPAPPVEAAARTPAAEEAQKKAAVAEWVPLFLLRSSKPPPTPDGSKAMAAARQSSQAAAYKAAAAAVEANTTADMENANGSTSAAKAAARAVGLKPVPPAELVGKYIALFFGASWCPHCRDFSARLHQVYSQLKQLQGEQQPPPFETIYIPCDRSPAEFAAFACTMPWLSLPFGDYCALVRRFGIRRLPSIILITPDDHILTSDAVPIFDDRDAAQKLHSIFQRFGPFESSKDRYQFLFGDNSEPKS